MTLSDFLLKDAELSQRIRIPDNQLVLKKTAALLAHSGDSWFLGAGLALLWGFGPRAWRPNIQLLFIGIVFTAIAVLILKFSIKRPRPEGEWGLLIWAILVDLSRVGLGVHYYSDILAGTGIGVLMGVLVQLIF
jgi:membrane-associated phospholipid phosphatase